MMAIGSFFGKKDPAWKSINDLDASIRVQRARRNKLELRAEVPIVVIDDAPFEPANNLKHNRYVINHLNDLDGVDQIRPYPIVLCDLQGVGAKLHGDLQGAHLIKEIKRHYPEKVVIAYSGVGRNTLMSRTAQQSADTFLKKDADLDEWIDALDAAIENVTDPVFMWKRLRNRLLDAGMTPSQLTELENAFVEHFMGGGEQVQKEVKTVMERVGIQKDLRAVIQGFVASLAFKAIIG